VNVTVVGDGLHSHLGPVEEFFNEDPPVPSEWTSELVGPVELSGLADDRHPAPAAARVRGLDDERRPQLGAPPPRMLGVQHDAEAGLREAVARPALAHQALVGGQLGGLRREAAQAERVRHARRRAHAEVVERQDAVDPLGARDGKHRLGVGQVDGVGRVGDRQPRRLGVAIDDHGAVAGRAHLLDRAHVVDAGAEDEHRLHSGAKTLPGCSSSR